MNPRLAKRTTAKHTAYRLSHWPFIAALVLAATTSQATVVQILHTNDLHASLETSGAPNPDQQATGGWAQLKTVMDRLTEAARVQGVETLKLDAGDFFEGTTLYFPDRGVHVLKAFQTMGYDACALGNHDWMQGARPMNETFGLQPFPFPVLAANVTLSPNLEHLSEQILPSTQVIKAGIKFGIVGVTTHEAFYRWNTRVDSKKSDFKILKTQDAAQDEVDRVRDENDVVIALTHIGFKEDQKLVANTYGLDLVVGGHSHTRVDKPKYIEDADARSVPIVQTGVNGAAIGKIMLEILPGKQPKILSYELVPILSTEAADSVIVEILKVAKKSLNSLYGQDVLSQKIGTSKVRLLSGESGPTGFSRLSAQAMREQTGADLAIDIGAFHGNTTIPKGDITRHDLMMMYPRKFEVEQNEGWYVYHTNVPGWVLKLGIKFAVQYGYYLETAGMSYDIIELPWDAMNQRNLQARRRGIFGDMTPFRARNIKIDGDRVCNFCKYITAVPEGLIRGAYGISILTKLVFRQGRSTLVTIWDALTKQLQKVGVIEPATPDENLDSLQFAQGTKGRLPWIRPDSDLNTDAIVNEFFKQIQIRSDTHQEDLQDEEDLEELN